jgi:hypothetical protein
VYQNSGKPLGYLSHSGHDFMLPNQEETRPSVFVFNHANAYAAWYEKWETHTKWTADLVKYLGNGKYLSDPPAVAGRPGVSRPMRLIFYGAPYIFSQAHPGTDYVTTHRHQVYDAHVRAELEKIGAEVVDSRIITKSMWESTYDGLHYLRGGANDWLGSVSTMVFHATLNTIFPDCDGM